MKLTTAKLTLTMASALLLCGCMAIMEYDRIENHADDVEVRVVSDINGKTTLQWQSQPGYMGDLNTQQSCKYFMPLEPFFGSWIKNKKIVPIEDRFVSLVPISKLVSKPGLGENTLISEFQKLTDGSCRYLVYGRIHCVGNAFCSSPFTILIFNSFDQSFESFTLPKRSGVPLRKWPKLGLFAVIEAPFDIGLLLFAVLAAPGAGLRYLLFPEAKE